MKVLLILLAVVSLGNAVCAVVNLTVFGSHPANAVIGVANIAVALMTGVQVVLYTCLQRSR